MRLVAATIATVLLLALGCAPRGPIVDTGSRPEGVGGTIAGTVTADGTAALSARTVTAVNVETGARFDTSTAVNGGYTVKVPAGKYKLEVELRPGEALAKTPNATEVNVGDLDAGRNFVVTVSAGR